MTAVTWAVIELWPSHDWAVIAVIELWSCCDRQRENFGAFTGPKGDFGLILWILNMIMHMSFTGPTQFLPVNVRGPVSFAVFAVTELWPSCDWAVTELWPSLAVTSHRGHRELTVTIFFSWELSDIVLKFGRYLGSSAADVPVKFRSDMHILTPDPVTLRLYETSRKDVFSDIKAGPRHMSH